MLFSGPIWALKEVPRFQPNVVDEARILDQGEVQEINDALENIRVKAGIWGAAHIVQSLQGESIESYSERVFRIWELGDKVQDNGLLLVISMQDRKSRLEVGYGLEGDLPDITTKRVLDYELAPLMRNGQEKQAIIQVFNTLALYKTKDSQFDHMVPEQFRGEFAQLREAVSIFTRNTGFMGDDGNSSRGLLSWAIFLICLWIVPFIASLRQRQLVARLEQQDPFYRRSSDPFLPTPKKFTLFQSSVGIRLFLSINPGVFIFIGASLLDPAYTVGFLMLCLFFSFLHYRYKTARYKSKEAHDEYIAAQRKKNEALVQKGFMKETSPGVFQYTATYFASPEYKASRRSSSSSSSSSSSRSSSSSSSSSGGGSSGGGGSSSSW